MLRAVCLSGPPRQGRPRGRGAVEERCPVASQPGAAWRGGSRAEAEVPGPPRAVPHSVLRLLQHVFIISCSAMAEAELIR